MNARRFLPLAALAFAATSVGCIDKLLGPDPSSSPSALFDMVWSDFDLNYATFDYRHVDWNAAYRRYKPRADSARSSDAAAAVVGQMFRELNDPHVDLMVANHTFYQSVDFSARHTYWNLPATIANYAPSSVMTTSRNIRYGKIAPDVGWIWIGSFGGTGWAGEIDQAIDALSGLASIVVDVRNNGGGSTNNSEPIAGRFVDAERLFSYVQFRNGPAHDDFSELYPTTIGPQGHHYGGRVIVLTNRKCASATETFVLAMRTQPGVRFLGDTTIGALSGPLIRELSNGWSYRVPQSVRYDANKVLWEAIGLAPDVYVPMTAADSVAGRDPQLERAITLLRAP